MGNTDKIMTAIVAIIAVVALIILFAGANATTGAYVGKNWVYGKMPTWERSDFYYLKDRMDYGGPDVENPSNALTSAQRRQKSGICIWDTMVGRRQFYSDEQNCLAIGGRWGYGYGSEKDGTVRSRTINARPGRHAQTRYRQTGAPGVTPQQIVRSRRPHGLLGQPLA